MHTEVKKLVGMTFAGAALTLGLGASAAWGEVETSANVTLASDYSFRGVSQTTRDPAIQGGFDATWSSGFYVGTWASTVNFGDDASIEWDLYAGYGGDINENLSYDFGYIRFEYPSEGDALDYNEIYGSLTFGDFTAGVYYSNEYLNLDDVDWFYPYAQYSLGLGGSDMSIDFHLGWNIADDNSNNDFESLFGDDQYIDYSVVLNIPVAGLDFAVGVYGTDIDSDVCDDDCEARAIFSVSKSF